MEPKRFLFVSLILIPYVSFVLSLTDEQCPESGRQEVNAHIENVVDEV